MRMWEFIYKTKDKHPVDRNVFIQTDTSPISTFLDNFKDADLSTVEFRQIFEAGGDIVGQQN